MSPTMATWRPARLPSRRRIVYESSSAWVGCSCQPSPALITDASTQLATRCGAPEDECRTTIASTPMASIVRAVSRRDSPLFTEDELTLKLIVSADSRFAAVSNESRVRVESS